jgi:type I restriction-modification system DNA methylase subunit
MRGSMVADDFRDYMLSLLFLRYLSDNYEAAAQKELGSDYPKEDVDTQLQLVMIEEDIKAAKDNHNAFLKELGLNPLP